MLRVWHQAYRHGEPPALGDRRAGLRRVDGDGMREASRRDADPGRRFVRDNNEARSERDAESAGPCLGVVSVMPDGRFRRVLVVRGSYFRIYSGMRFDRRKRVLVVRGSSEPVSSESRIYRAYRVQIVLQPRIAVRIFACRMPAWRKRVLEHADRRVFDVG